MFPTPTCLAPTLFQLLRYRPWTIGPQGCDSVIYMVGRKRWAHREMIITHRRLSITVRSRPLFMWYVCVVCTLNCSFYPTTSVHPVSVLIVHCDGATYWATGVKDRSITQPRVSLLTFSPPWNGGIFGTYRLTGLRIRSYVPTQTSIQILGTKGDVFIIRRTRKHFFLGEMFEVVFELVSSTMPNVMVLPTELPG